jgi:hypothetical protein
MKENRVCRKISLGGNKSSHSIQLSAKLQEFLLLLMKLRQKSLPEVARWRTILPRILLFPSLLSIANDYSANFKPGNPIFNQVYY